MRFVLCAVLFCVRCCFVCGGLCLVRLLPIELIGSVAVGEVCVVHSAKTNLATRGIIAEQWCDANQPG